jgi:alpha-mannosidase
MTPRVVCTLIGIGALLGITGTISAQTTNVVPLPTLYYIPHTHWEGAVFKTREEYLDMGLPHILQALALLRRYPDFKFTLDQVAYIKPFLERYPEEAVSFRKFVAEGRLQIVGGMDVMPDVVKPGGELFVRQMQYGKRYCHDALGVDVTVGWLLDTFGHHPQLPQLLKLAGYKSFWFCRGVPSDNLPSEFNWRGIDGTEIPAFWLPGFYGLFYGPPRDAAAFAEFFKQRYNSLASHVNGPERVGLSGVDVSEPEEYVPPLIAQYERRRDRPFAIRYSVPTEFENVVKRRKNTPVFSGDFNPIFQGTYSSRIELKQITRLLEARLITAEKLGALAAWLGVGVDDSTLWGAWEPVLFNQTHDLASGVMTDHVYEDVRRGYDLSQRMADESIRSYSNAIVSHIDTRGAGIPVVVFNTLAWTRTDPVEIEIGFAEQGIRDIEVTSSRGGKVPCQLIRSERYADGGIKTATISVVVRDVPALGYVTLHVHPKSQAGSSSTAVEDRRGAVLENEFYTVKMDRSTGAIVSLFDRKQQWESISGPANVVARQEDHGDLWELYHGLDGASYIAGTVRQPVPSAATALLSSASSGTDATVVRGVVFSEFRVSHPFGSGLYSTRIRLYSGVRRVEISTDLVNHEKLVRYQVLFPTSIANGTNVQEIPFGAIARPIGVEFPAQHWVDYSETRHGMALINTGMPGNLVSDGTLILSLMRAHSIGGYGFGGGFEPGMTSETGYEIGHSLTFRYALVPHAGDWRGAAIYRSGLEFNQPLLVFKSVTHGGTLPPTWGWLNISHPNVVLTACKPGPGKTTVVRFYEASGVAASGVTIKFNADVKTVREANLLDQPGRTLPVRQNVVRFNLHPFEIKTLLVQFASHIGATKNEPAAK